jgi:glutamate formiminotransferase
MNARAASARGFVRTMATSSSSVTRRTGGLVAVVYVSEGKNEGVVANLERTAEETCEKHGAKVVNVFRDVEYNRTGFTLGMGIASAASLEPAALSGAVEPLRQSALALTEKALSLIDLRTHTATHPRCGVVDHISCHAIGDADDAAAACLAKTLGERIGVESRVPVLLYGNASGVGTQLAALRRRYGYFKETAARTGGWAGEHVVDGGEVLSDYGPSIVPPEAGVVMLGATPWIYNYNVPVAAESFDGDGGGAEDVAQVMTAARRVAKKVSERGGGLVKVQAMALPHGKDGDAVIVEIACNLLDVSVTTPAEVQDAVERACREEDAVTFRVKEGYVTNLTPEEMLARLSAQS